MNNVIMVIARLFIAHIFFYMAWSQLGPGYAETQKTMQALGISGKILPIVLTLEIAGGLCLVIGFITRWAAMLLAIFCLVTAIIFHRNFSDPTQLLMFMKSVGMAGGLLILYVHGPGEFSIDEIFTSRRKES